MTSLSFFYKKIGKSLLDYTLSMAIIFFLSWLWLSIVIIYLITFQFPVFYIAERIGKDGQGFRIIKFRTLSTCHTAPLQSRRFWLGDFLRATNLDELPQLWNVLKGEMSLVGPRPLPVAYAPLLSESQKQRHAVLPGITGLAQINGKNSLSWEKKFEYDLIYIENISLTSDVLILIKTVLLILSLRRDVSLKEESLK